MGVSCVGMKTVQTLNPCLIMEVSSVLKEQTEMGKEKRKVVSKYCFNCHAMESCRDYIRYLEKRIEDKDDSLHAHREVFRQIANELCIQRHRAITAENLLVKDDGQRRKDALDGQNALDEANATIKVMWKAIMPYISLANVVNGFVELTEEHELHESIRQDVLRCLKQIQEQ